MGPWGSGKTTFLKMWAGELRKFGLPVVYLDAFQHDYAKDASTAVASEIIALANSKRPESATKAFSDKAIGAGKVLLRSSLELVKAATFGALSRSTPFKLVPWFIIGFLVLAALRSFQLVPDLAITPITRTASILTVLSMTALGVDVRVLSTLGGRVTAAVTLSLLPLLGSSIGLVHLFR